MHLPHSIRRAKALTVAGVLSLSLVACGGGDSEDGGESATEMITFTADNGDALYIPEGCAHGFLTLDDATEAFYTISAPYVPDAAFGVRYDDPAFGIAWPEPVRVIHERDAGYADWTG